jgi:hypothetical protein
MTRVSPRILEMVVNEEPKAERVRAVGSATVLVPTISPPSPAPAAQAPAPAAQAPAQPPADVPAASAMMSPDEALQVLGLAQRTAENHITAASRHAQQLRSEAEASAERIRLEAHTYAEKVRAEADRIRDEARAAAELRHQEAEAQAAEIRRQAEAALAAARAEAERIVSGGQERAEQLDLRAKQRYEDAVGSLAIKREALQKQIEALAVFDADYRHRLASFMHTQLRALWIDQSGAREMPEVEIQLPGGPVGCPEPI